MASIIKSDPFVVNQYTEEQRKKIRKEVEEMMAEAINDPKYQEMKAKEPATTKWYWQRELSMKEIVSARSVYTNALEEAYNRVDYCLTSLHELEKLERQIVEKTGTKTLTSFTGNKAK